jgi:hypothetical protein
VITSVGHAIPVGEEEEELFAGIIYRDLVHLGKSQKQ